VGSSVLGAGSEVGLFRSWEKGKGKERFAILVLSYVDRRRSWVIYEIRKEERESDLARSVGILS